MTKLHQHKSGLAVGSLLALWHVGWCVLVVSGTAEAFLRFILWAHFIEVTFAIQPFNVVTALILIAINFVAGYVVGTLLSWIWNRIEVGSSSR